jgi:hypothetical protein
MLGRFITELRGINLKRLKKTKMINEKPPVENR